MQNHVVCLHNCCYCDILSYTKNSTPQIPHWITFSHKTSNISLLSSVTSEIWDIFENFDVVLSDIINPHIPMTKKNPVDTPPPFPPKKKNILNPSNLLFPKLHNYVSIFWLSHGNMGHFWGYCWCWPIRTNFPLRPYDQSHPAPQKNRNIGNTNEKI